MPTQRTVKLVFVSRLTLASMVFITYMIPLVIQSLPLAFNNICIGPALREEYVMRAAFKTVKIHLSIPLKLEIHGRNEKCLVYVCDGVYRCVVLAVISAVF